jgi:hypothetical protein
MTIICWLLPFSSDVLWPLWKIHLNRIERSKRSDPFSVLATTDTNGKTLEDFVSEHLNSIDTRENKSLKHGLAFIRDYKEQITSIDNIEKDGTNNNDYSSDHVALVMQMWIKYLHKKGEFTWTSDENARLLVDVNEVEQIRLLLKKSLEEICKAENFEQSTEEERRTATCLLNTIYEKLIAKEKTEVIQKFLRSVFFVPNKDK